MEGGIKPYFQFLYQQIKVHMWVGGPFFKSVFTDEDVPTCFNINEPRCEKTGFLPRRKQRQISASQQLISAFVFATRILQFLYFLSPKLPVSSNLLCSHSSGCVRPGRKPQRQGFSRRGSNILAHVRNSGIM